MSDVYVKTKILTEEKARDFLYNIRDKKIFIVCDKFMSDNGIVDYVTSKLNSSNTWTIFNKAIPDPTLSIVVEGVKDIYKFNPDIVIGFGGGSPIDTAKAIIHFANQKDTFKKPLFVTIPTTSGTGSEVTSVSVILDSDTSIKHLLTSEDMLCDIALLDASLTLSVPQKITAHTGLDVLTHAVEAYVAKDSNVFSDALAEKSVELLLKALLVCYKDGNDYQARRMMQESSTLAGMAFNTAGLGLNHSIAHQLGGTFHIPHGLANAMLLNRIIDFNSKDSKAREKYAQLSYKVQLVSPSSREEVAIESMKRVFDVLINFMEVPTKINKLGIEKENYFANIDRMAINALKDFCISSNPTEVSISDIKEILEQLY